MKAKTQESNEDLIDDFNFNINKTKDLSFAYISLVVGLIFILTGAQQSYQYLSTASLYQEMRFYWAYTVSLFSPALIMILIGVLQFYYSRLVLRSFK